MELHEGNTNSSVELLEDLLRGASWTPMDSMGLHEVSEDAGGPVQG